MTSLIEQHKDDAARLTVRLSGTEKQRDDALEALVLQQEIAEELERERKRNKKEIATLQHTNKNVFRQREEAQRVVVHLRSLISGQTHHMEHIVRSLHTSPELLEHTDDHLEDGQEDVDDRRCSANERLQNRVSQRLSSSRSAASLRRISRRPERSYSPVPNSDSAKVTPSGSRSKRLSESSLVDVADRHLRDKAESIANIIRNISDQCAAAVEGLQLAHNAEQDMELENHEIEDEFVQANSNEGSEAGENVSELGFDDARSSITAVSKRSSIPPTPDLYRSSTAMSMNSMSTANDRNSQQFVTSGLAPKIIEGDEESERGSIAGTNDSSTLSKVQAQDTLGPVTAQIAS